MSSPEKPGNIDRRRLLKGLLVTGAAAAANSANAAIPGKDRLSDGERRDLEWERFLKWFKSSKHFGDYLRGYKALTPENQVRLESAVYAFIVAEYQEGVSPPAACAKFDALHTFVYTRLPGDSKKRDVQQPTITHLLLTLSLAAGDYLQQLQITVDPK